MHSIGPLGICDRRLVRHALLLVRPRRHGLPKPRPSRRPSNLGDGVGGGAGLRGAVHGRPEVAAEEQEGQEPHGSVRIAHESLEATSTPSMTAKPTHGPSLVMPSCTRASRPVSTRAPPIDSHFSLVLPLQSSSKLSGKMMSIRISVAYIKGLHCATQVSQTGKRVRSTKKPDHPKQYVTKIMTIVLAYCGEIAEAPTANPRPWKTQNEK
mmetsp:Transcript_155071/g.497176  ORF Transcript_155071/g.497176 Transcript_155071/m.497176 type:complete len:210 (+) Transcript_155071:148-777(+)